MPAAIDTRVFLTKLVYEQVDYGEYTALRPTTQRIGELHKIKGLSYSIDMNRSSNARFSYPIESSATIADELYVGNRGIEISREGDVVWSGLVWTVEEDGDARSLNASCLDWFETIERRVIRHGTVGTPSDPNVLPVRVEYTDWHAGDIVQDLLYYINLQGAHLTPETLTAIETPVTRGGFTGGSTSVTIPTISIRFEPFTKVGAAIKQLTDIEDGPDFAIDPVTRKLTSYVAYSTDPAAAGFWLGTKRSLSFDYNTGKHNAQNIRRTSDMSQIRNRFVATGNHDPGQAEDTESVAAYGIYEEHEDIGDVSSAEVLLAYAGAEVAILGRPLIQFGLVPQITNVPNPQPFVDFQLGDVVKLNADLGRLQIVDQDVRIFGFTVNVDDMGGETVPEIRTSPQS